MPAAGREPIACEKGRAPRGPRRAMSLIIFTPCGNRSHGSSAALSVFDLSVHAVPVHRSLSPHRAMHLRNGRQRSSHMDDYSTGGRSCEGSWSDNPGLLPGIVASLHFHEKRGGGYIRGRMRRAGLEAAICSGPGRRLDGAMHSDLPLHAAAGPSAQARGSDRNCRRFPGSCVRPARMILLDRTAKCSWQYRHR